MLAPDRLELFVNGLLQFVLRRVVSDLDKPTHQMGVGRLALWEGALQR